MTTSSVLSLIAARREPAAPRRATLSASTALIGGVIAAMLVFQPLASEAQTWDGQTSTNWGTATNWDGDALPAAGGTVIVNNGLLAFQPLISGGDAFTVAQTNISTGGLTISGTLTSPVTLSSSGRIVINNGGQLVGSLAYGSNGTSNNAGTITGALSVSDGDFTNTGVVTGATSVSGGALSLNAGTNLADGQLLTVTGGTVNVNAAETVGGVSLQGGTIAGAATLTAATFTQTGGDLAGTVSSAGAKTLEGGTISGTLTGAGATTIQTGTTTVSGTIAGDVSVDGAGTLRITNSNAISGTITTTGSVISYANGVNEASQLILNSNTTQLEVLAADVATQSGNISELGGARPLEKIGAGTLIFTNANTYTGATTISAGTLQIGNGGALIGGSPNTSGFVNNGTLTINSSNTVSLSGVISGTGAFNQIGTGLVTFDSNNTYAGTTTITSGTLQVGAGGAAGTLGTGNVVNNATLTFNRTDIATVANAISGNGTINQAGTGATILTGASGAFAGITNVNAGILRVNGTLGSAASTLNVNPGGTLQGIGTVGGNVNVLGGTLAAGQSPGTLTIAGNLVLNGASVSAFELGQANVVGGANNDLVNVGGALTLDGTLNITSVAPGFSNGFYRLYNYGGALTNNTLDIGTLPAGFTAAGTPVVVLTNVNGQVNLQVGAVTEQFWDGAGLVGNGVINGGAGTWNAADTNWTNSPGGDFNTNWQSVNGTFAGAAGGAVTVVGTQAFQQLNFTTAGYVLGGAGSLATTGGFSIINTAVDAAINVPITGAGGLTKIGAGILSLGGVSTYAGATDINAGTLRTTVANALPTNTAVTVSTGATFDLAGNNQTIGSLASAVGGIGSVTLGAGTLTMGGNNASTTFAGIISGAGGLVKAGTGVFTLSGVNTYAGATAINAGTLRVGVANALPANTAVTIAAGGTLDLAGNNQAIGSLAGGAGSFVTLGAGTLTTGGDNSNTAFAGVISGAGGLAKAGAGVFTLGGVNTYAGATAINGGTLRVGVANALPANTAVSVGAGGTLDLAGNSQAIGSLAGVAGSFVTLGAGTLTTGGDNTNTAFAGIISGTGGLTKVGTGVFTLSGVNTYAGLTTIQAGTLANTGTLAGGANVTGGTLNTSGTINGGLTNSATTIASGNISGGITNTGAFSLGGALNNNGGALNNNGVGTVSIGAFALSGVSTLTNNSSSATAVAVGAGGSIAAAAIANNAGRFTNAGTVTAPTFSNAAGATLSSTGTLAAAAAFTNNGTFNGAGTLNSAAASNAGVFNVTGNLGGATTTFNNAAAGTFNLAGGNFTGIGTFNNSGVVNSTGTRTLGAGAFNNAATGNVSLVNGVASDVLTMTGTYAGAAGSRVSLEVNTDAGTADRLNINGAATGSSRIDVTLLGVNRFAFATPVDVVTAGAGTSLNVTNLGRIGAGGFFDYFLRQNPANPNSFQVISQFNSGPVSGVAAGIAGVVNSLQAGFHQPASAIISRPDNCQPNQLMGGPFIRLNAGETTVRSNSAGGGNGATFSGSTKSESRFSGGQGGVDLGICNVNNTGWNLHAGIMGGFVQTKASGNSSTPNPGGAGLAPLRTTTQVSMEVPFIGGYMFATNGPFTAEFNVRKDYYNAKVGAFDPDGVGAYFVGPSQRLKGDGLSYNGSMSYRFSILENAYFEPQIGLSKGTTRFDNLQFATGAAGDFMNFSAADSLLGRIGFNAGIAVPLSDSLVVVPFVSAAVWHEFAKPTKARAIFTSQGLAFDIQTDRVGTFGQVGAGVQFRVLNTPLLGFLRADMRFGDKIEGKALNAGLRLQF